MPVLSKKQEITVTVESLAFGGRGIARINNFVVFINKVLPGQTVRAVITRVKKSYAEAVALQVLDESPWAIPPRCRHFGDCGGCQLQNLVYEQQLEAKSRQVSELLHRIGGMDNFTLLPILGSQDLYHYRNKMEFSFARERWLSAAEISAGEKIDRQGCFLGLHAGGFFGKVVDIEECRLINPSAAAIVRCVREAARDSKLPVYSTIDHAGFWRFLVVRSSVLTDDLMVNVITSTFKPEVAAILREKLMSAFPQITSLYNGVTRSKAAVAFCEEEHLLAGDRFIWEKIDDFRFRISPNSFFQTNSKQVKRLYEAVLQLAEPQGDETVFDLYCGAGTISIYVSPLVRQVIGFESVASAVEDARVNCQENGVDNCRFVLADLKDQLSGTQAIIDSFGRPDLIILDPPRGGLHPKTVQAVLALSPKKIVHVSCNPATLARELEEFCRSDYMLGRVQPVDMFPHTAHIEVVAELIRK